jgi:ADP-L-glycero-D-manno-heptose 6-epimerase
VNRKKHQEPLIVVTGAAGFIGSGVVRHLNDRGFSNLLLVDNIEKTDKWKNLQHKHFIDFIPIHELFSWLEGRGEQVKAFIHLGACSDTLETDGNYLMENNYRFTVKLAEYALEHGHRFIYASSAATYGDGSQGFSDDHDLLDQLRPLNLYGYSKHRFDLWAKRHGVLEQLVGLKYFNIFGPNENHKGRMASMVYKMVPNVLQEGLIRLYKSSEPDRFGDGEQCRDFLYVKDAARMTCDFLENDHGGIFNIGRGEVTTWNRLGTALFNALNKPVHIEYMEMPPDLIKQYQNYTCADMSKYQGKHAYAFQYSVEEAVRDYVQDHLLKDERW